jgi:hypothetical protein
MKESPVLSMEQDQPVFSPIGWRWPEALRFGPVVWIVAGVVGVVSWVGLPVGGNDWREFFGVAARTWWPDPWAGVGDFPYVPWTGLLLSPLGGIPDRAATTLVNIAAVIVCAGVARRLKGPDWIVAPVLISPPGFWMFRNGQMEWLSLMGLLMFNGLDLLLLAIKPQVGLGVLIPRLKRARGQWIRYLAPSVIVGAASLVIWLAWPLRALPDPTPDWVQANWNWSIWPWGVPVAIFLLWRAWKTGEDWLGVVASPLLSPYVNMPNYLGMMLALAARWPRVALGIWIVMWLVLAGWLLITFI